jgi:hypothetical protein
VSELIEAALAKIVDMLRDGAAPREIHAYINSEKTEWHLTDKGMEEHLAAALAHFTRQAVDSEVELAKALERLNRLYALSLNIQDYKTCLAVQREINSLLGLKQEKAGSRGRTADEIPHGRFNFTVDVPRRN